MTKSIQKLVLTLSGLALAGVAFAGSPNSPATGTVGASLVIDTNCHITASSSVSFGTVDPTLGTAANGSGSIGVKCTKGTTLTDIKLDAGGNFASGTRQMSDGSGDFVAYSLYKDNAHSTAWGDDGATISASSQFAGYAGFTSAVVAQTFNVYGLVSAAAEDVPAGAYNDTVNVTVDF
ncbi:MAG: spore coat U domain-containing protein [Bacillota bacterium]